MPTSGQTQELGANNCRSLAEVKGCGHVRNPLPSGARRCRGTYDRSVPWRAASVTSAGAVCLLKPLEVPTEKSFEILSALVFVIYRETQHVVVRVNCDTR